MFWKINAEQRGRNAPVMRGERLQPRSKTQEGVNQVLFYDFEVFAYDWLVVVMDMTAKKTHVIIKFAGRT